MRLIINFLSERLFRCDWRSRDSWKKNSRHFWDTCESHPSGSLHINFNGRVYSIARSKSLRFLKLPRNVILHVCTWQSARQCLGLERWSEAAGSLVFSLLQTPVFDNSRALMLRRLIWGQQERRHCGRTQFTHGSDIWLDARPLAALWLLAKWRMNWFFVLLWNFCATWGILLEKSLALVATDKGLHCVCR